MLLFVRSIQRNRVNRVCICVGVCVCVQLVSKGSVEVESFFLKDLSLCFLKPSTDWMMPAHIMEGYLLN